MLTLCGTGVARIDYRAPLGAVVSYIGGERVPKGPASSRPGWAG